MSGDTSQVVTSPKVTSHVTPHPPHVVGGVSRVTLGRPGEILGLLEEIGTLKRRLLDGETKLSALPPGDPRFEPGFARWADLEAEYRRAVLRLAELGVRESGLMVMVEHDPAPELLEAA